MSRFLDYIRGRRGVIQVQPFSEIQEPMRPESDPPVISRRPPDPYATPPVVIEGPGGVQIGLPPGQIEYEENRKKILEKQEELRKRVMYLFLIVDVEDYGYAEKLNNARFMLGSWKNVFNRISQFLEDITDSSHHTAENYGRSIASEMRRLYEQVSFDYFGTVFAENNKQSEIAFRYACSIAFNIMEATNIDKYFLSQVETIIIRR